MATGSNVATFDGHDSWVWSVSFSPDGKTVVSGAADYTVKLWDLATGRAATFEDHSKWVVAVAFSPDGTTFASGSHDGTVKLWDVATGSAITIEGHAAFVQALALSPDGTTLASAMAMTHDEVQLWDVATGIRSATLRGHTRRVNVVVFSPDGATLASGSSDQTVKLWDVGTGADTATFEAPGEGTGVGVADFSPDGRRIASGHGNATVKIWDVITRELIATLEGGHIRAVGSMAFSPDGSTLATGDHDGVFRLWNLASGRNPLGQERFTGRVYSVSFTPHGTALALGWAPDAGVASIWEVPAGASVATLSTEYPASVSTAAFSPDGSILLSGSSRNNVNFVEVRNVATGTLIATLEGHGTHVGGVAFSLDGSTFASGSSDGTVLVWDMQRILPQPRTLTGLSGHGLGAPFVIEVRDQHGDSFEGAEVTFRVTGGGGILSVETTTTDARGQAASTLTLGRAPGPNTVEVTVAGLERVIFTAHTRSVAQTLSKVNGDEQQGPSGAPLAEPFVVSVLDQVGSPFVGAEITYAVQAGGGILSVTTATTDTQGRASTTLTLGRQPGTNTVRATLTAIATVGGGKVYVTGFPPVTFTAVGLAVPQSLTKLSGDEQQAAAGAQLAEPLVVSVEDQNGEAYPGAVVTFAILGEGGTLSAVSDTTDAEGRAATTLTLGEEYGTYSVVATVADLEPVSFSATAKATPDFDGDGEVGFGDFFLFAEAFGGSDPRFDLDASGSVDFADFFLFAEHFGQPARAKLVALARELIGLPEGPQLRQNAPNPFNSQTVIPWFVLQPGSARLEVFAVTGQRVAVLHQGPQKAGLYRLRWDGRDDQGRPLASGVYVYRLVTAAGAQTRKFTLLR